MSQNSQKAWTYVPDRSKPVKGKRLSRRQNTLRPITFEVNWDKTLSPVGVDQEESYDLGQTGPLHSTAYASPGGHPRLSTTSQGLSIIGESDDHANVTLTQGDETTHNSTRTTLSTRKRKLKGSISKSKRNRRHDATSEKQETFVVEEDAIQAAPNIDTQDVAEIHDSEGSIHHTRSLVVAHKNEQHSHIDEDSDHSEHVEKSSPEKKLASDNDNDVNESVQLAVEDGHSDDEIAAEQSIHNSKTSVDDNDATSRTVELPSPICTTETSIGNAKMSSRRKSRSKDASTASAHILKTAADSQSHALQTSISKNVSTASVQITDAAAESHSNSRKKTRSKDISLAIDHILNAAEDIQSDTIKMSRSKNISTASSPITDVDSETHSNSSKKSRSKDVSSASGRILKTGEDTQSHTPKTSRSKSVSTASAQITGADSESHLNFRKRTRSKDASTASGQIHKTGEDTQSHTPKTSRSKNVSTASSQIPKKAANALSNSRNMSRSQDVSLTTTAPSPSKPSAPKKSHKKNRNKENIFVEADVTTHVAKVNGQDVLVKKKTASKSAKITVLNKSQVSQDKVPQDYSFIMTPARNESPKKKARQSSKPKVKKVRLVEKPAEALTVRLWCGEEGHKRNSADIMDLDIVVNAFEEVAHELREQYEPGTASRKAIGRAANHTIKDLRDTVMLARKAKEMKAALLRSRATLQRKRVELRAVQKDHQSACYELGVLTQQSKDMQSQ